VSTPKTQSGASILKTITSGTTPPVTGTVNQGRAARRAASKAFKKSQQQAKAQRAQIQPEVDMNRLGNVTRFNKVARRKAAGLAEQARLEQIKTRSPMLRTTPGSSFRNVAKAAVAQQTALAPVNTPVTKTAMQNLRSATRKFRNSTQATVGRIGNGVSSSAGRQLKRVDNQVSAIGDQAGKVARRIHENRPMTKTGLMVRVMCAGLFCVLTVRFLWVGAPKELWILLLVWGMLMLLYFYKKMDLCLKVQ
jgi:hypothetical protein